MQRFKRPMHLPSSQCPPPSSLVSLSVVSMLALQRPSYSSPAERNKNLFQFLFLLRTRGQNLESCLGTQSAHDFVLSLFFPHPRNIQPQISTINRTLSNRGYFHRCFDALHRNLITFPFAVQRYRGRSYKTPREDNSFFSTFFFFFLLTTKGITTMLQATFHEKSSFCIFTCFTISVKFYKIFGNWSLINTRFVL